MREIKFRAKDIDTKEWRYGYYTMVPEPSEEDYYPLHYIENCDNDDFKRCVYIVDPNTVGQYTGINDKNGKELYEGDFVQGPYTFRETLGYIIFKNGFFCVEERNGLCSFLTHFYEKIEEKDRVSRICN